MPERHHQLQSVLPAFPNPLHTSRLHMLMQIFFSCSKPSPDVTFRFVHIQNLSGRLGERRIDLHETLCHVLVHRTLTYPKLLCSLPYRCIVINDKSCYFHSSFFYITLQGFSPATFVFTLYAGMFPVIRPLFPLIFQGHPKRCDMPLIFFLFLSAHTACNLPADISAFTSDSLFLHPEDSPHAGLHIPFQAAGTIKVISGTGGFIL